MFIIVYMLLFESNVGYEWVRMGTEMMVSERLFLRKKMRCMTRAVRAEKFTAA